MHEERDTLWHFVMSVVKYHESHYVAVLDRYVLTKQVIRAVIILNIKDLSSFILSIGGHHWNFRVFGGKARQQPKQMFGEVLFFICFLDVVCPCSCIRECFLFLIIFLFSPWVLALMPFDCKVSIDWLVLAFISCTKSVALEITGIPFYHMVILYAW